MTLAVLIALGVFFMSPALARSRLTKVWGATPIAEVYSASLQEVYSNYRSKRLSPYLLDKSTVVSGRLNVVKGLNEQIKLSVLEEVNL